MLENFEEETQDLTEAEMELARQIAQGLSLRVGKGRAITSKEIIDAYRKKNIVLSGPKIRKMVNHICHTWLPNLIGTSRGYYVTNDVEELKRAAGTLISRANANNRRADTIFDYLKGAKK